MYHYRFCFVYLFYDLIRRYGPPLNPVFSKWPPRQINCPPLACIIPKKTETCWNWIVCTRHSSSRMCVISAAKVPLLGRYQAQVILAVTGLRGSRKLSLLTSQVLLLSL